MRIRTITIGAVTALAVATVVTGGAPANATPSRPATHAATAAQATAAHPLTAKPAPQAPADAYSPGHPRELGKPKRPAGGAGSAERALTGSGWQLTVSASQTSLWPTQYSTLTASIGTDVGPTPYYLLVYDTGASPNGTSGTLVASCGAGTVCTVSVTQPRPTFRYYDTVIASYSGFWPPANIQARVTTSVGWKTNPLTLNTSAPTVDAGQSVSVAAVANDDVGPTPFFLSVFDATTGQRIAFCSTGRVCQATVSSSVATTHRYVAYWGPPAANFPPTGFLSRSNSAWQSWTATGWRLSMAQNDTVYSAFVNGDQDLGPTPYYLQIYAFNDGVDGSAPTGTRLGACGSGTSCTVTMARTIEDVHVVAFVSTFGEFIPANIQASSWVLDKPVIIT
jgi:hypothetical protein